MRARVPATVARVRMALALTGAIAAAACTEPPAVGSGAQRQVVVGIVTSVGGSSPSDVNEFTLRTRDGQVLSFEVGTVESGGDAFPPGHLREHQANAEPVRVTYVDRGGSREAIRLADAP